VPTRAALGDFSLSSHKEERVGERRPFGSGRGEREPGFDRQFVISLISIAYWNNPRASMARKD